MLHLSSPLRTPWHLRLLLYRFTDLKIISLFFLFPMLICSLFCFLRFSTRSSDNCNHYNLWAHIKHYGNRQHDWTGDTMARNSDRLAVKRSTGSTTGRFTVARRWYTGRWWVGYYIWYSEEGPGRARPHPVPSSLYQNNVAVHPSTASVPTSYYLMRQYNCFWTVKG